VGVVLLIHLEVFFVQLFFAFAQSLFVFFVFFVVLVALPLQFVVAFLPVQSTAIDVKLACLSLTDPIHALVGGCDH
jgi:hypothetical protein